RTSPDDTSEMSSQLLYGEHFKVLEQRKVWSRIRVAHDKFEGWARRDQIRLISEEQYHSLETEPWPSLSTELLSHICDDDGMLIPVPLGSVVGASTLFDHHFEGHCQKGKGPKQGMMDTALLYLKAPFLAGGRTPFGIDCSGF